MAVKKALAGAFSFILALTMLSTFTGVAFAVEEEGASGEIALTDEGAGSYEETALTDEGAVTPEEPALADEAEGPSAASANDTAIQTTQLTSSSEAGVRTIMLYDCGTNLETDSAMASYNLRQILAANFSADEDVRFIIMTGGANQWWLESSYLYDPATNTEPDSISNVYNQIWEAKGLDAPENPGKLVLLDGDGLSGDGENAKTSAQEQMVLPETLKAFVSYCVENFPAEKYDLILWDHGGGPRGGYGQDDHHTWNDEFDNTMSFTQLIEVFQDNAVTSGGGKFDFIDFDACVMNSVEQNLAFADYTDYYIASPEYIPGYGQYYTNWLNAVGKDPHMDTFAIGKIMVDDFIAFYDKPEGDGSSQEGTLAIVNTQAMLSSGLVDALIDLNDLLRSEILEPDNGQYLFYNELDSVAKSISYGSSIGYDLGNLVSLLAINFIEAHAEDVEDGTYSDTNEYLDVAQRILAILGDPDIMYAGGTSGIASDYNFHIGANGEVEYDKLYTSGMYISFINVTVPGAARMYYGDISEAIAVMPQDKRAEFMREYALTFGYYALVAYSGSAVNSLVNGGYGEYKLLPKDEINYEEVKAYWKRFGEYSDWRYNIGPLVELLGGEDSVEPWISAIVLQQAAEAVSRDNVTSWEIEGADGTAYKIKISETAKRLTSDVHYQLIAELPMVRAYIEQQDDEYKKQSLMALAQAYPLVIDVSYGDQDWDMSWDGIETEEDLLKAYIEWYNNTTSLWNMSASENKWWAIQDAEGNLHVVEYSGGQQVYIPVILEKQNGVAVEADEDGNPQLLVLVFKDNELSELRFITDPETLDFRSVMASDLVSELEVLSVQYIGGMFGGYTLLPISETTFLITGDNANGISLVYTDVANISDIADTTDDKASVSKRFVVTDIYGNEIDITEQALAHANGTLRNIDVVEIEPATYNGKGQTPIVVDGDKVLVDGVDYEWEPRDDADGLVDVGEHWIRLFGMGEYADMCGKVLVINPAEYTCVSGDGSTWTKTQTQEGGESLAFTFKRSEDDDETYGRFTGVLVDGKAVDASNYTVERGSVIVSLNPAYLEALSVGDHVMTAQFNDGTAEAAFSVSAANDGDGEGAPGGSAPGDGEGAPGGSAPGDGEGAPGDDRGAPGKMPATGDNVPAGLALAAFLCALAALGTSLLARRSR